MLRKMLDYPSLVKKESRPFHHQPQVLLLAEEIHTLDDEADNVVVD